MRSQTKIALIFFVVSLSIIILFGLSVYYFSSQYAFTDFYARLKTRAVFAAKSALENEEKNALTFKEIRELHLEKLEGETEYFIEINKQFSVKKEAQKIAVPNSFLNQILEKKAATYKKDNIFYAGILHQYKSKTYLVIVSAANYYNSHHLVYLRNLLIISIVLTSFLALLISILFSKMVFNPVKQIAEKVHEISAENMHLRLDFPNKNDEISELVKTFNTMLDRLETAFETQNNFISNASHELSTPLTAIIGEADVALNKVRQPEEYIESLKIVVNEAERLERITRSLLFLAQSGFDGKKQKMETIRTDQLLWDVKETIDKINPKNNVFIDLSLIPENPKRLKIIGNVQLLHLALSNIVSNACKYSSNTEVRLSIGTSDSSVIIVVKDWGIGIPENEIKYIYDLFFRASNTKKFEGYGIGLPLARNIIRMHNGSLEVSSKQNEGATVQIKLPSGML